MVMRKVNLLFAEGTRTLAAGVDAENAKGPLMPLDDDSHAAGDAVFQQHFRGCETRFGAQVLHHHRFAGEQGEAGL